MIDKSDCSRDFSKKITKKHPDTHKKIRNCNDFENSLNFAKVSLCSLFFLDSGLKEQYSEINKKSST